MFSKLFDRFASRPKISDKDWLTVQFHPKIAHDLYGISLPTMPSDEIQLTFTSLSGNQNMRQAYEFYLYALKATKLQTIKNPKILDFGGGWGRIARLFLRETAAENIYIAETREYVVGLLRELGSQFRVIHNKPEPPLADVPEFDLVFAYSVFSHLSEKYFLDWIGYFLSILKPGGHIVFTSRGHFFIDHLETLHSSRMMHDRHVAEHINRLKNMMPSPTEIRRRFDTGEFQFYPLGGSGELSSSFFGEAFIPEAYLRRSFPLEFVTYVEDVPAVDQSIIVLQKR